MEQEIYIKSRILHKAKQNKLMENGFMLYADIKDENFIDFNKSNINGEVIIGAVSQDNEQWVILTSKELISRYDNKISKIQLLEINKRIRLPNTKVQPKEKNNVLIVGNNEDRIWVPSNTAAFGLWNLLRMFPLSKL